MSSAHRPAPEPFVSVTRYVILKGPEKGTAAMKKWQCIVCDHIYDPERGDELAEVHAETAFEELPHHYACPDCGADKTAFEPIEKE